MSLLTTGGQRTRDDRSRSRWLGESPAPTYLAPSEPKLEGAHFFARDRHGDLRLRPGPIVIGLGLAVVFRPGWDLATGRFLADGWWDYAFEIIAATVGTLFGLISEYRKHST